MCAGVGTLGSLGRAATQEGVEEGGSGSKMNELIAAALLVILLGVVRCSCGLDGSAGGGACLIA